jgi:hypothetical protein
LPWQTAGSIVMRESSGSTSMLIPLQQRLALH